MSTTIVITNAMFNTPLNTLLYNDELGTGSVVFFEYHDKYSDFHEPDIYSGRLQRASLAGMPFIDCTLCRLNGRASWQVDRRQPQYVTIGQLLMQMAGAPDWHEISSDEFFSIKV